MRRLPDPLLFAAGMASEIVGQGAAVLLRTGREMKRVGRVKSEGHFQMK